MEKKLEEIMSQVIEKAKNAQESGCPEILIDDRLEDAFLSPEFDEDGYSEPIPAIYNDYGYGKDSDGVLILTLKSASLETRVYTKYLDDEALVWDTAKEELFLYIPDPDSPKVAFKAGRWRYAKKLKPEYSLISLHDIYLEKKELLNINPIMNEETKKKIKERIEEVADENGKISMEQFLGLAKEVYNLDPQRVDEAIASIKNSRNDLGNTAPITDGEEANVDDLPF